MPVASLIYKIAILPNSFNPLNTPSLAIPGPLNTIPTSFNQSHSACFNRCLVRTSAAYGVFCFAPLYPTNPVPHPITLSHLSLVRVMIVLFSDVNTWRTPVLILMSFFFALAIIATIKIN
jgi:hypothetical protein